jgi:hypothetical protein
VLFHQRLSFSGQMEVAGGLLWMGYRTARRSGRIDPYTTLVRLDLDTGKQVGQAFEIEGGEGRFYFPGNLGGPLGPELASEGQSLWLTDFYSGEAIGMGLPFSQNGIVDRGRSSDKSPSVQPSMTPTPETTGGTAETPRCSLDVPFHPTYLPEGFSLKSVPGPAEGAPPPDKGQAVIHYTDGQGHAIEVRRPGTSFVELAQADNAPEIEVLGQRTSSFGPTMPGDDDFIVQFHVPADARAIDCRFFSLDEYGVSEDELVRVAEGLTLNPDQG